MYISHGTKYNTIERHVNAPLFKRVFDCGEVQNATLTITAVGLYKLWLNGTELNKSVIAPYMSNPDQLVFFDTYDVGNLLKQTDNVLCVLLGNGFVNCNDFDIWLNETADYRDCPKFDLQLTADGKTLLQSDENFCVADSPITFDDFRCGERYDARLEKDGVLTSTDTEDFEPSTIATAPKGKVLANDVQPVVAGAPKTAVSVTKTSDGYLYDFGVNDTGVCNLSLLTAESGQQVDLYYGEVLDGQNHIDYRNISFDKTVDGYNQHDVYVCKFGKQSYTPSFTWHGFRYCEVKGLTDEQATLDAVKFVSVRSDLPSTMSFRCDNEEVNKIAQITLQSDISGFVLYPYDCPQREKNGWTADASLSAEQMLYSFDAGRSLAQWLTSIRGAQRANGQLPGIVPTAGWGFEFGCGPAWDSVLVELPYQLFRFDGNEKVVRDNAEAINKYFAYADTRLNEDGLASFGLGDWCQTYTKAEWEFQTPLEVTDTLTLVDLAAKVAVMYDGVGIDSKHIVDFADKLVQNFRKKYIRNGKLLTQTQTALAMALQTGVLNDVEDETAYADLKQLVANDNDHMRVGVVGYKYLLETLVAHGDVDLCFKLITQSSAPSYGYIVRQGATTLWEVLEEYYRDENGKIARKDGSNRILSFNHHFWGGVLAWIYKYVGWIDPVDSDTINVGVTVLQGVNGASTAYRRNGKSLSVVWKRENDEIKLTAEVDGFVCLLSLPDGETSVLQQGVNEITIRV